MNSFSLLTIYLLVVIIQRVVKQTFQEASL